MSHVLASTENSVTGQNLMAMAYRRAGKPEAAIRHYRESLRLEPNGIVARYDLGVELEKAGQLDEAAQHFAVLLQCFPRSHTLLDNLGSVRLKQGKFAEALGHFREAIRWNPQDSNAYRNAGAALQAMGEPGAAVTNYNAALSLDPDSIDTLSRLADLLARCPLSPYHQPEAAIRLAKRATGLTHDEVADYLDTLATAYAAAGQYTNAIVAGRKAIEVARKQGATGLVSKLQGDLLAFEAGQSPEVDWKQTPRTMVR